MISDTSSEVDIDEFFSAQGKIAGDLDPEMQSSVGDDVEGLIVFQEDQSFFNDEQSYQEQPRQAIREESEKHVKWAITDERKSSDEMDKKRKMPPSEHVVDTPQPEMRELAMPQRRASQSVIGRKSLATGSRGKPRSWKTLWKYLFVLLFYIAVGWAFYYNFEGWTFSSCVYFSMVVVTTVGYGDLLPSSDESKIFTSFYVLFGIAVVGFVLGALLDMFVEQQKRRMDARMKKFLDKVDSNTGGEVQKNDAPEPPEPERRSIYVDYAAAMAPIFFALGCGCLIGLVDGWSFVDCLYFSVITVTSVGFGDITPSNDLVRGLCIIFLPFSVLLTANAINNLMEVKIRHKGMKMPKLDVKELRKMDKDGDGEVSEAEYLAFVLIKLKKTDEGQVDQILGQFRRLDTDNSGVLDEDDLDRLEEMLGNES